MNAFDRSLRAYSMAALAAGVGVTALTKTADAKVDITTNISIPISTGITTIDLNHDGIPDVSFSRFTTNASGNADRFSLYAKGAGAGNDIQASGGEVFALIRSAKIGPSQHFSAGLMVRTACTTFPCTFKGKWHAVPANRFVGVKFRIKGQTHYGWIRVTVKSATNGTITEYGYETISNKMLKAGLKSNTAGPSLGILGVGADGLSMWRK